MAKRRRVPREIENKLREVRRIVTMDSSSFSMPGQTVTFNDAFGDAVKTEDVTAFIREWTRNWRGSWIEHPLDEVLEWIETGKLPRRYY